MTPFNVAIVRWVRGGLTFSGRATRSEYWWPRLLVFCVNLLCLSVFVSAIGPDGMEALVVWLESDNPTLDSLELAPLNTAAKFSLVFVLVFGLLTFLPDLAVTWRRFHDLGQPGWIHLIFFVIGALMPIIALAEYIWLALPGQKYSNRYGPDPLNTDPDIF